MREKVNKAETIKRNIDEFKRIEAESANIKFWGICLYYDEECENRMYTDLPVAEVQRFIDEFIIKHIKDLEIEFAAL